MDGGRGRQREAEPEEVERYRSPRVAQGQGVRKVLIYQVCCIYHRPKPIDESSDESSSSSDSDDSDSGGGPPKDHDDECPGHKHSHRHNGRPRKRRSDGEKKDRRPSPNAYERVPKVKGRPTTGGDGESGSKSKA